MIAVENARLLSELQAKNASLTEALEQQTATSVDPPRDQAARRPTSEPVLRSRSWRTRAGSATQLTVSCSSPTPASSRLRRPCPAWTRPGSPPSTQAYPRPIARDTSVAGRHDSWTGVSCTSGPRDSIPSSTSPTAGHHRRCAPSSPCPSSSGGDTPSGRSASPRRAPALHRKQIALLQTFTEQAVIAIENVRLFTELDHATANSQVALEQQMATTCCSS